MGNISQVQAGTDIEKLPAQTQTPLIRRSDNSDDVLRIGNMDTHKRARENETVDATQNAPTIMQTKRRYKKIEKHKDKTNDYVDRKTG